MMNVGMNQGQMMNVGLSLISKALQMSQKQPMQAMGTGMPMTGMPMTGAPMMGDMVSFSPEAMNPMMGGNINQFNPFNNGGIGQMPMMGMNNGMGQVPGMQMPMNQAFNGQQNPMGQMGQMPGMGQMGRLNKQQIIQMLQGMMKMLQGLLQQMGVNGNMGGQQQQQGANGIPGVGQAPGMQQPTGIGGPQADQGQQGGTVELKKGESYTTPGGCKIEWKGDTVKVDEPGGNTQEQSVGTSSLSSSGNQSPGIGGSSNATPSSSSSSEGDTTTDTTKPNKWKVYGDPHITDGAGKTQDFQTNNAMFSLKDGSKVAMTSNNPKGVVDRVKIFLPGTALNKENLAGIDASKTMVYNNKGLEKHAAGTLDKMMGQFPNAGFAQAPGMVPPNNVPIPL